MVLVLILLFVPPNIQAQQEKQPAKAKSAQTKEKDKKQSKPITIKWKTVKYATAYRVQIRNKSGSVILEQDTNQPELSTPIQPGSYSMRVGVITPFEDVATWTDWKPFQVKERPSLPPYEASVGWYIIPGATYRFFLPPLDSRINQSYPGAMLNIGIFGTEGAWRWLGLELQGAYDRYSGSADQSMFNVLSGGLNMVMVTRFNFPLNLAVRLGGGTFISRYEWYDSGSGGKKDQWSVDYYATAGVAMDWSFYRDYFLQLGLDYTMLFFVNDMGHALNLRLGVGYRQGWGTNYTWKGKDEPPELDRKIKGLMGFKIAAGYAIYHIVESDPWQETISFANALVNMGIYGKQGVLKWFGLEFDIGYHYVQQETGSKPLMHTILGGASLRVATPFNFPVNAVVRLGGGIMFTNFQSDGVIPGTTTNYWSLDTYYKAGLAAEIMILGPWYAEVGVEYMYTAFYGYGTHGLHYYVMTGVKL